VRRLVLEGCAVERRVRACARYPSALRKCVPARISLTGRNCCAFTRTSARPRGIELRQPTVGGASIVAPSAEPSSLLLLDRRGVLTMRTHTQHLIGAGLGGESRSRLSERTAPATSTSNPNKPRPLSDRRHRAQVDAARRALSRRSGWTSTVGSQGGIIGREDYGSTRRPAVHGALSRARSTRATPSFGGDSAA